MIADLTRYGFKVVGRAPAHEVDRYLGPFTSRHLKAKVDTSASSSSDHHLAKVVVDIGDDPVDIHLYDGAIGIFQGRAELLFVFENSENVINTVAELVAKASKWPKEIEVDAFKLERKDLLNYRSQIVGERELVFSCNDAGVYGVVSFEAGVFEGDDCIADVSKDAKKPVDVMDVSDVKALLKQALVEAKR
jgi:hypothetical protein